MPPADAEIVARVLRGDEEGLGWLVRRHSASMLRLARSFVRDAAVAEEVVQETWLAVLDGIAGFERRASLKTWIFRILVNRAIRRAAREGRSVPLSALGAAGPDGREDAAGGDLADRLFDANGRWIELPTPWAPASAEELLLRKETRDLLRREIDRLPDAARAVVVLRDVEGLSADEACEILGIADGHQRVLLHRGRARLREALHRHLKEETT